MPDTIQDRVLKVIATTKRIPLETVHPDSTFEALGIDSLDRLNILFDLESEFDIEINDDDAKKVQNIHEMVQASSISSTRRRIRPPRSPHLRPQTSRASCRHHRCRSHQPPRP